MPSGKQGRNLAILLAVSVQGTEDVKKVSNSVREVRKEVQKKAKGTYRFDIKGLVRASKDLEKTGRFAVGTTAKIEGLLNKMRQVEAQAGKGKAKAFTGITRGADAATSAINRMIMAVRTVVRSAGGTSFGAATRGLLGPGPQRKLLTAGSFLPPSARTGMPSGPAGRTEGRLAQLMAAEAALRAPPIPSVGPRPGQTRRDRAFRDEIPGAGRLFAGRGEALSNVKKMADIKAKELATMIEMLKVQSQLGLAQKAAIARGVAAQTAAQAQASMLAGGLVGMKPADLARLGTVAGIAKMPGKQTAAQARASMAAAGLLAPTPATQRPDPARLGVKPGAAIAQSTRATQKAIAPLAQLTGGMDKASKAATGWNRITKATTELFGNRRGGFLGALTFATARLSLYSIAALGIFRLFSAIRAATTAAVELDKVLRDIQGVLPSKSREEALIIGRDAVRLAKEYGVSISQAAASAKIFAQTGQTSTEVARSLEATLLAVRGANLGLQQAQELIIAISRITEGEVEALDILNRISRVESRRAITATDLGFSIQRIGPLVKQLRGDMTGLVDEFDIAMGAVTTIVENTRVSGLNASTSLRFILSRFARPSIIKRIQEITGVGVARPGGTELRPFSEILTEVSVAYQRLVAQGKSGKAFELLGVIGGARQLQATAALMEDFAGSTLPTARLSALAFNDSAERTGIALESMDAKAKKVAASWAALGSAMINNSVVQPAVRTGLDATSGVLNAVTFLINEAVSLSESATNVALDVYAKLPGMSPDRVARLRAEALGTPLGGKFAADLITPDEVLLDEIPRLKAFHQLAAETGRTTEEIIRVVGALTTTLAQELEIATGLTGDALLEILNRGAFDEEGLRPVGDRFRMLHNQFGVLLADGLAEVSPEIQKFDIQLANATTTADRAAIQVKRIAEAYEFLGDATFAANGELATNRDRVLASAKVFEDQISTQGIGGLFGKTRQTAGLRLLSPQRVVSIFEDVFSPSRDRDINAIFDIFRELPGATDAWRTSLMDAANAAHALGKGTTDLNVALDNFAQFLSIPENRAAAIENIANAMEKVVLAGRRTATGGIDTPAGDFARRTFSDIISLAGELERMRLGETFTAEDAESLRLFGEILENTFAKGAAALETTEFGLSKTRRRLLELLTTFTIAIDSANTLADAYGRIGIAFDRDEARLTASKTLFEGLTKVQNELRKEVILTDQQIVMMEAQLQRISGISSLKLGDTSLEESVMAAIQEIMGAKSATAERTKATLESLQQQLSELDGMDLSNIFGDTASAQAFETIMGNFLQETLGTEESLERAWANFIIMKKWAEDNLGIQEEIRHSHAMTLITLKGEADALQAQFKTATTLRDLETKIAVDRAQQTAAYQQRILGTRRDETDLLENQITLARNLYDLEASKITANARLRSDAAQAALETGFDEINARFKGDITSGAAQEARAGQLIAFEKERLKIAEDYNVESLKATEKLTAAEQKLVRDRIVDKFIALENQISSNITSATAGLRTVLTDFDAMTHRPLETILGSIGSTFIERTANSFVDALINSNTEGLIGQVARAYGSAPEVRMREQLQAALAAGGHDIARSFAAAGLNFNKQLAAILGYTGSISGGPSAGGGGGGPKGIVGEHEVRNQALLLAGSLIGPALNKGGKNAQLGGQLGATIGGLALPGLGGLFGGLAGGIIGGFFDKNDKKAQTATLQKIEANTRQTADILEIERRLIDVSRGAVNVPTAFTLPAFTPNARGQSTVVRQTNSISAEIHIVSNDGAKVVETIRAELGPMLQEELNKIGV